MTAQRQERYGWRRGMAFILALAAGGSLTGIEFAAQAATTERIVANRYTGLAIEGIDPVSYFTDARPIRGEVAFEASQGGVVWRFSNADNRAFFVARPDIYSPQFGGYDPVDVARGVAFAGNSRLWLIKGDRLYLFGHEDSRAAFAANPDQFLREAGQHWSRLLDTLAQ
jgi:YHS domain-containing protein